MNFKELLEFSIKNFNESFRERPRSYSINYGRAKRNFDEGDVVYTHEIKIDYPFIYCDKAPVQEPNFLERLPSSYPVQATTVLSRFVVSSEGLLIDLKVKELPNNSCKVATLNAQKDRR